MSKYSDICWKCNNEGRTKDDPYHCSACGRSWYDNIPEEIISRNVKIPMKYNKRKWTTEDFKSQTIVDGGVKDIAISYWVDKLIEYKKSGFKNYSRTTFIYAPRGSGLYTFIYSLISDRDSQDISTKNIINLEDVNLDSIDFREDLRTTGLMVFELININLKENIGKLNYILNIRQKNDLETIIISRISFRALFNMDVLNIKEIQKNNLFSFDIDNIFERGYISNDL